MEPFAREGDADDVVVVVEVDEVVPNPAKLPNPFISPLCAKDAKGEGGIENPPSPR